MLPRSLNLRFLCKSLSAKYKTIQGISRGTNLTIARAFSYGAHIAEGILASPWAAWETNKFNKGFEAPVIKP